MVSKVINCKDFHGLLNYFFETLELMAFFERNIFKEPLLLPQAPHAKLVFYILRLCNSLHFFLDLLCGCFL